MKKQGLNAIKFRALLVVAMFLISVSAVGGFYVAQQQLHKYAKAVSQLNADAQAGDKNIQTLRSLEKRLNEEASTIKKAQSIVAQSKQYRYQDQIVSDLSSISRASGVTITGFDFLSSTAATGTPTVPATPVAPTVPAPTATGGLKSQTVTVTISSPLSYTKLLDFIKKIELNPLKMQIASVSLTKDEGNSVSSQTFAIEVYVQ